VIVAHACRVAVIIIDHFVGVSYGCVILGQRRGTASISTYKIIINIVSIADHGLLGGIEFIR